MKYKDYSTKEIQEADLEMLLSWRNSERIHSVMLTEHKISPAEHHKWFSKLKTHNPARNLLFCYQDKPIGYIGFNDYNDKSCVLGVYIAEVAPIDAALVMFCLASQYAFSVLGVQYIVSEVLNENKKSLRLNKLIGYEVKKESKVLKNGKEALTTILELHKNDWDMSKFLD